MLLTTMPSDIAYFIVRPMDVGLELFLTLALAAKSSGRNVEVEYKQVNRQGDGRYEGELISLMIE